ncbi:MAG: flagellar basal body-associated FliL family protein [Hyphomicrobiaceae bacterium]|nr:flagellar basal body-associated FliL family protein [Hyphomicrobiaceae bacterium]
MAKAPEKADEKPPAKSGGGFMGTLIGFLVITGLGLGAGGLFGMQAAQKIGPNAGKGDQHASAAAHDGHGSKDAHGKDAHGKDAHGKDPKDPKNVGPRLVTLPAIVTNLLQPEKVWIRIEASAVMEGEDIEKLTGQIVEDVVAYFKTCTLEQIQGGSGYQYMREDLNERVRVRGQGKVRDFVLQSFIVE